ncbi:MAG: PAS domain S-box protein [Bacteroidetes bacterium]|nr:MAG: PAS domain S-box protein [Bacteroidota bacterium]
MFSNYASVIRKLPMSYSYQRAILNSKGEVIDFEILEANELYASKTQYTAAEIPGKKLTEVFPKISDEDFHWMIPCAIEYSEGSSGSMERFCLYQNRWFKVHYHTTGSWSVIFFYEDITDTKMAEFAKEDVQNQHKVLSELTASEHYTDGNIYEFIKQAIVKASGVMKVWRTGVWFFDEDGEKLRNFDNYDSESGLHSSGMLLDGYKYNSEFKYFKKSRYVDANDALNDKRVSGYLQDYLIPLGITSMLDAAIVSEGKTIGILCFEHKGEKRTWQQHEINFGCELASKIANVLRVFDKKITQSKLLRSENKLKSIFLAAPSGMGLLVSRVFQDANDKLCQMTGYSHQELIGKSARMLYCTDEDFEYVGREKYRQIDELGIGTVESRFRRKDGQVIHVLVSSTPLDPTNQMQGIIFTATDITSRKNAEEKLRESELRMRQLAANIPGAVYQFHVSAEGKFDLLYMSDGGAEIFEKPIELLTDETRLFEEVCPEHRQGLKKSIFESVKSFTDWSYEFCILLRKGRKKWIRGMSKPRKDGLGGVLYDGVLLDITPQKTIEEKLRINEKRYQSIVENQRDMICRFLPDTTLTFVNPAYCRYFGKKEEDLTGRKFLDFLPSANQKLMKKHLSIFRPESASHTFENKILLENRRYIWQEWSTIAFFDHKGNVMEFQSIGNDITDKKERIELEQELKVALESGRFKKNFLANMSHEIRTPLTGIIGMTEILGQTQLDSRQLEYLSLLRHSGENLMELINKVLDYSDIEKGALKLKYRRMDLQRWLKRAEKYFYLICKSDIGFESKIDEALPRFVEADKVRLEQILHNLISNAVKFTLQGHVRLVAELVKLLPPGEVLIKVSVFDTGIGIPEKRQKDIFQPFMQVDDLDTRGYEGAGLGLSICQNLVSLHGGKIGFESKEGKGSCFWFTFKASQALEKKGQATRSASEKRQTKPLKILFAEDKKINQQVISLLLTSMGHEVTIAENGKQALEFFKKSDFDLILMDIQMPEMDGITAVSKLRAEYKELPPIIGLSANTFEVNKEKYKGMDGYLTKPVKKSEIEEVFKSFFPVS